VTSYDPNHLGMAEFLNSGMMLDLVNNVAERIRTRAVSLSPVGTAAEGDEHPGLYISSFHIRSHRFGGVHRDRAEAVMYNDAQDAVWVEFGHSGREPYHVIRRAAEGIGL
jgi:hypothetical protein